MLPETAARTRRTTVTQLIGSIVFLVLVIIGVVVGLKWSGGEVAKTRSYAKLAPGGYTGVVFRTDGTTDVELAADVTGGRTFDLVLVSEQEYNQWRYHREKPVSERPAEALLERTGSTSYRITERLKRGIYVVIFVSPHSAGDGGLCEVEYRITGGTEIDR